jgi:hypothetical protein
METAWWRYEGLPVLSRRKGVWCNHQLGLLHPSRK